MFGKILGILPFGARRYITRLVQILCNNCSGKIAPFFYRFCDEILRSIYGTSAEAIFVRKFNDKFKMILDVTQKTQRQLYLLNLYEPHISNFLLRNLKEGDFFVDIGAHCGFFSLLAASLVGKSGIVWAFEPEEENFKRLLINVKINGCENVYCFKKAVSNYLHRAKLYLNPLNEGGNTLEDPSPSVCGNDGFFSKQYLGRNLSDSLPAQEVEAISLDQFLRSYPGLSKKPDIIKIDTEGHELSVLLGMKKLLDCPTPPTIICEVGKNNDKILGLLCDCGYKIFKPNKLGEQYLCDTKNGLPSGDLIFVKRISK